MLDESLSEQSSEQASSSAPAPSPSALHEKRVKTQWSVMSKGKETTTVMTLFGAARPLAEQLVHDKVNDDQETEVNYDGDSPEEAMESASGSSALEGEHQAEAFVQELPSSHDKGKEERGNDISDSPLSITSDLIMIEGQDAGSPAAAKAKPVLNAKDIMSIVERKDISIKTPVPDHNPQRKGLEDNLFDFGDALCDYTSDGGTIRINQGLATLMLIAATAEAPNRLLMESKRAAFEQVTAQAKDMLEKQRHDYEKQCEAIEKRHQELANQHYEHLENMRKQNELLQAEVMKARGLYSKAFQQFEIASPAETLDESRALKMQTALALSLKNKAERHKTDYEMERAKRLQKEKDLEEAEERIKKLKEELAFLEDTFEVVAKRPLARSDLDSPELHAEKKVKIEEVPDIMSEEVPDIMSEGVPVIKSVENIKSVMNVSDARSRGSKPTVDAEDSLVLNSDGEIVSQRDRVVD